MQAYLGPRNVWEKRNFNERSITHQTIQLITRLRLPALNKEVAHATSSLLLEVAIASFLKEAAVILTQ